MESADDLRFQAAKWRRAAEHHDPRIGAALRQAADLLDQQADALQGGAPTPSAPAASAPRVSAAGDRL